MGEHEAAKPESPPDPKRSPIQREIVKLHKEFFGRGPVRTKLYLHEDSVLVLMFNGHTPSEQTLLGHGGRRAVAQTRVDLSESMRASFIAVIERETGREVVGFMSSSQQDPDLLCHVYVLKPTDLLSVVPDEPRDD
jgi:uncharacterized protein YbcI